MGQVKISSNRWQRLTAGIRRMAFFAVVFSMGLGVPFQAAVLRADDVSAPTGPTLTRPELPTVTNPGALGNPDGPLGSPDGPLEDSEDLPEPIDGEPEITIDDETPLPAYRYRLVYMCQQSEDDKPGLCTVDPDGKGGQVLLKSGLDSPPVWSLDAQEIYYSVDQGAAEINMGGGLPALPVPHNTDVFSIIWNSGQLRRITADPAPEVPLQAFPTVSEIYLAKGIYANPSSVLAKDKHEVAIKLRMMTLPCFHSFADQSCRIAGSDLIEQASECDPIPLPGRVGISPNGVWATYPALHCTPGATAKRVSGLLVVNHETKATIPLLDSMLGTCRMIDENGGVAIRDDGLLPAITAQPEKLGAVDCRFYLSPDQAQIAYITQAGIVHIIPANGDGASQQAEEPLSGVNRLRWSPDGAYLLAYHQAGGAMIMLSPTQLDQPIALGAGVAPSWSPVPVASFSSESDGALGAKTFDETQAASLPTATVAPGGAGGCGRVL